jgi:hypothetical protein
MKAKVRLKGVFKGLLDYTNERYIPKPLFAFLANLTSNSQFIPNNFLTEYEINLVELDTYGKLVNI